MLLVIVSAGLAFFIGSIPVGFLLAKRKGVDVRLHGSGNIGATNVGRTLGRRAGIATLILDLAKGVVGSCTGLLVSPSLMAVTGLCCIFGHCYSPFLRFRGGKGVATGVGAFLILAPIETLAIMLLFVAVTTTTRYVALGSIFAALALPILIALRGGDQAVFISACITAILIIARHLGNISRLIEGSEHQIGLGRKFPSP